MFETDDAQETEKSKYGPILKYLNPTKAPSRMYKADGKHAR
jgi:hypothetical protein